MLQFFRRLWRRFSLKAAPPPLQPEIKDSWNRATVVLAEIAGFVAIGPAVHEPFRHPDYLNLVRAALRRHGVDTAITSGYATICAFSAASPDPAIRALDAAFEIRRLMTELRQSTLQSGLKAGSSLQAKCAIVTGQIYVGPVGSEDNVIPAAVGPGLHLANRMLCQCGKAGVSILMCAKTAEQVSWKYSARPVAIDAVSGGAEVTVFEPVVR